MSYDREEGIKRHDIKPSLPFIIGNTRKKRSTKKMVEGVAELKDRNPKLMDEVIDTICDISKEGLDALMRDDAQRMGDLMNINHGLLAGIGVSTMKLEILIHTARQNGELGAKLTGAGGGGCMIALADEPEIPDIERAIRRRSSQKDCLWI